MPTSDSLPTSKEGNFRGVLSILAGNIWIGDPHMTPSRTHQSSVAYGAVSNVTNKPWHKVKSDRLVNFHKEQLARLLSIAEGSSWFEAVLDNYHSTSLRSIS